MFSRNAKYKIFVFLNISIKNICQKYICNVFLPISDTIGKYLLGVSVINEIPIKNDITQQSD